MGNTRYYTKTTGQTFAELQYDAWGQPVSPNKLANNDHGNYVFATFTGHIYDTTLDIYFAEARFYDATNRTWMAMDPIKDGLNWYQYVNANPITYWDANGLTVIGIGFDATAGLVPRFSVGRQLVFDFNGNVGILTYVNMGGGTPAGGFSGTVSISNANEILDMEGIGGGAGAAGNIFGANFGGDVAFGSARDGSPVAEFTLSVGAKASLPVDARGYMSYVWVQPYDNIWEAIGALLEFNSITDQVKSSYFDSYNSCGS